MWIRIHIWIRTCTTLQSIKKKKRGRWSLEYLVLFFKRLFIYYLFISMLSRRVFSTFYMVNQLIPLRHMLMNSSTSTLPSLSASMSSMMAWNCSSVRRS